MNELKEIYPTYNKHILLPPILIMVTKHLYTYVIRGKERIPCYNGKIHGIYRRYYSKVSKNSNLNKLKIKFEIPYVHGNIEGMYIKYSYSGKVIAQFPYKNGMKNGLCKSWTIDGIPRYETTYVDHVKHGSHIKYDYDGKIELKCTYENNYLIGDCYYYRPDGTLRSKLVYHKYNKFIHCGRINVNLFSHTNYSITGEIEHYYENKDSSGSCIIL